MTCPTGTPSTAAAAATTAAAKVASLTTVGGGADTLCVTDKVVNAIRVGCVVGLPGTADGRGVGVADDGVVVGGAGVGAIDGGASGLALGYGLGPAVLGLCWVRKGVESSRAWLSEKNAMWVCTGRHNGNHLCRMKGCRKRKAWLLAKHTSKYYEVL